MAEGQEQDLVGQDDCPPLRLDASSLEQFRTLNSWHISFAHQNPKTFRELNTLLSSLGARNQTHHVSSRMFKFAQESFTEAQRLRLTDQIKTLAYLPEHSPIGGKLKEYGKPKQAETLEDKWEAGLRKQKDSLLKHGTLRDLFLHSITKIHPERNREILSRRLGLDPYDAHTLEETGKAIGITRERVRQIVKKEMIKLEKSALWDDVFREEAKRLLLMSGPMLPVADLENLSVWFTGFNLKPKSWEAFLEYFAPDLSLLKKSSLAWLAAKENVGRIEEIANDYGELKSEGASVPELSASLAQVSDLEIKNPQYFETQISAFAPKGHVTETSLIRKFVRTTKIPFDLQDFYHFCMTHDHVVDSGGSRYIESRFSDFSAPISRSPTKYISDVGLKFLNPYVADYVDQFLDYWVENFREDRIFHGDEVRDWALSNNLAFNDPWGSWWAVAPLKLDAQKRFQANKLVIGLSKCWKDGEIPTRIELIEDLLRTRGYPMKARDIAEELYPRIGFGDIYQIPDKGKVRLVGKNIFEYRGD